MNINSHGTVLSVPVSSSTRKDPAGKGRVEADALDLPVAASSQVTRELDEQRGDEDKDSVSSLSSGQNLGELIQRMRVEMNAGPDRGLDRRTSQALGEYRLQQELPLSLHRQKVSRMMGIDDYA